MLEREGRLWRFFGQAGWAHNQILRSLEVLLGVSGELISAVLATEMVFGAVVTVRSRLLSADS